MITQTVKLIEDGDDVLLPISDEMMNELDLEIGDSLDFKDNKDGTFTMTKANNQHPEDYYLVECIGQFRMRYMVKARTADHARETVAMEEAKEFSQLSLREVIFSTRKMIDKKDVLKLCDEDNDYAKAWSDETKFDAFVTEDIYSEKKKS